MTEHTAWTSPTTLADLLGDAQAMDLGVRPLWDGCRVAGPAYPVRCPPGDNLMLHAAIHRAEPGSVIVVQADDVTHAVAGGNVCAVAQRRGIAGLVVDGVVRDLAEIRAMRFPVLARGVVPVPGAREALGTIGERVRCGGVDVGPGDLVVGDEEGLVVIPADRADQVLARAREKQAEDAATGLDDWERDHRARITAALQAVGFTG